MNRHTRGSAPYEAPEAEIILADVELGFMDFVSGRTGNSTVDDLVEEDYSEGIIWN